MIDYAELESAITATYTALLPIPPWWPADERAGFLAEHASQAAYLLMTELDDVVDRATDWAARAQVGADELSAMIAADQDALIEEARTSVRWDLDEAIAEHSAELLTGAVFDHPRRRPGRVIWPPARRR